MTPLRMVTLLAAASWLLIYAAVTLSPYLFLFGVLMTALLVTWRRDVVRERARARDMARHPASRDHAADLTDELIRLPIVRAMPIDEAATWLATAREIADARYADEFSA